MLSPLRIRLRLHQHIQQSLRNNHTSTAHRRFGNMGDSFFSARSFQLPGQSVFQHSIFRRAFSIGRSRDPYASFYSARREVWAIIGVNVAVFGAWRYAIAKKDQKLLRGLTENFTTSLNNWKEGRVWTLVTSAFSHIQPMHLAFNCITFYAFGTILATVPAVGSGHIFALCMGSAIVGSYAFIYRRLQKSPASQKSGWGPFTTRREDHERGLGASGMVMGAGAAATCLRPFTPMSLMFIPIPIPLWVLTLLYAGFDTYYLHSHDAVGHDAHLGGSVFGALYYLAFLRRGGGIASMLRRGSR